MNSQYDIDYLQVDSLPSEGLPLYDKDDKIVVMYKQPEERHLSGKRAILNVTTNQEDSYNLASRAITSFRIYKEDLIGYKTESDTVPPVISGLPVRIPVNMQFNSYAIESDQLKFIREICEQIGTIEENDKKEKKNKVIRLALSRFNRSYNEDNAEDMLVDLMICFETLFVGGKDEKAFQVALLPTIFLKNKARQKFDFVEMYYVLKKAYSRRGNIVHDGQQFIDESINVEYDNKPHLFSTQDFLTRIRGYARICLQHYVRITAENGKTSSEMKENLRTSLIEDLLYHEKENEKGKQKY